MMYLTPDNLFERSGFCAGRRSLLRVKHLAHRMSKKAWIILLGLVLILGTGWYFVLQRHTATSAGSTSAAGGHGGAAGHRGGAGGRGGMDPNLPVPVVAGTVERKDVPIFLDGLGTVQAFNAVNVKARVDGQLDKVAFTEGQDVKVGDLLAQIDPRPYQAMLDQAVAKKAQDEAMLGNGQVVLKRDEDLINKKVLDQQTYDTQKFTVAQLEATVKADQAAIDNAQTQVDYTRITAPLAGRVGVRQVDQGNLVHAADAGGLVVITQLQPISVVFTLPEQNFQLIRDNYPADPAKDPMTVLAVGRDNAGQLGQGMLAVIDNQIDSTTGTIKLKATFANDDLRLWPGQFINARLLLTIRKAGLVVPAAVVQRGPQGSYAFVIKPDQTVEARTIKVAQTEDGLALIDDGLRDGERVVVDGQYKLQGGSKVVVSNPPSGSGDGHNGQPHDGSRRSSHQTAKANDATPAPLSAAPKS